MSNPPQFSYVLPTDAEERRRLDMQHRLVTLAYGGLYYPPDLVEAILSAPPKHHAIIDIGTGSGAWAEDMARAYPDAEVAGVDIVPPESSTSTPPNCHFRFEDVNNGFSHYNKRYAIAHMRMISHGVDDFRGALHKVAEIIQPGGLLLVGSASMDTFGEDKKSLPMVEEGEVGWSAVKAIQKVNEGVLKKKFEMDSIRQWVGWLREDPMYDASSAGDEAFWIPIGPWRSDKPGHSPSEVEAGRLLRDNFKKILSLSVDVIAKDGVLDSATLNRWLQAANAELDEMNPPLYACIFMTWARRSQIEWVKDTE